MLLVTSAMLVGQSAMLVQFPLVTTSDDTHSYTDAAQKIMASNHQFVQSLRTPGYPSLLAAVFSLFGQMNLTAVVVAQMLIGAVTVYELYALVALISRRPYVAACAAALMSLNLYALNWERVIYSESLSYWSAVTLVLSFVLLVRSPGVFNAIWFGLWGFVAIMVRPATLLLPVALLAMFLLWSWRNHFSGAALRLIALTLVVTYGLTLGYMEVNQRANGYFGLTYVSNVNLYGKVEELNMQGLSVDPRYLQIQEDTLTYDAWFATQQPGIVPDPWAFPQYFESQRDYNDGQYGALGQFAENVILRHPAPFVAGSLKDVVTIWLAQPILYATFNENPSGQIVKDTSAIPGITGYVLFRKGLTGAQNEPWWVNLLLVLSTLMQYAYYLLPALLLIALTRMWRQRSSAPAFLVMTLGVCVLFMIVTTAFGGYIEFYRIRYPMDWAVIVATVIVAANALEWLLDLPLPAWLFPPTQAEEPTAERRITPRLVPTHVRSSDASIATPPPNGDDGAPRSIRAGWRRLQPAPDYSRPRLRLGG